MLTATLFCVIHLSWVHHELDVAMVGKQTDLTYTYDVSIVSFEHPRE